MTQATTELFVPYINLAQQTSEIMGELLAAAEQVLGSGHYVLGPEVAAFEREFAQYCQTRYAVGVSNGTAALTLVLRRLGLRPGDEVITAPNSFIASASSIAMAGARPVFADIGPDLNLDPDRVAAAVTPRTRAIMPVHLTGRPCRMDALLEIARRHSLFVLEDAAQSVGASWNERRVGSFGDAAAFSLHPLKNLHAFGDGGVITTSDETLWAELVKARNHGLRNREACEFWSINSRLDEIQAAWLRVQLRHLDRWTAERRRLAFRYHERLRQYVEVPEEGPGECCVYQTYMIQAEDRDALVKRLNEQGVEARVHYPIPLHLQPVAKSLGYTAQDFPAAVRAASRIISLPLYPGLTESQQDRVAELIAEFYGRPRQG
jgi:dTDP-4-amino-4,6-dideoxygalactose transaminase